MEELTKLDKIKLFSIIIVVLLVCYGLLKLTYNNDMKKCTEAGYSETYCHNGMVK